jgi:hypothetical protein
VDAKGGDDLRNALFRKVAERLLMERATAAARPPKPTIQQSPFTQQLSPRAQQLLGAIVGQRPDAQTAGQRIQGRLSQSMGLPAYINPQQQVASRADLIAQTNPNYQQEEPFPEPPPNSDLTPEEWADTDPEFRARVWEAYDGQQMITKAPQQFLPGLTPSSPAFGQMIAQQTQPAQPAAPVNMARPEVVGQNEIGQRDVSQPPPGWSEGPEDDAEWARMELAEKQGAWKMHLRAQRQQALIDIQSQAPAEADVTVSQLPGIEQGVSGWNARGRFFEQVGEKIPEPVKTVFTWDPTKDSDLGKAISEEVGEVEQAAVQLAGEPLRRNKNAIADGAYYMMTHDGEMPSDWGEYSTWISQFAGDNALLPDNLASISYLKAHPELWDEAIAVYDEGGADALTAWYEDQVGPIWAEGGNLVWDPFNQALILLAPANILRRQGVRRAIGPTAEVGAGRGYTAAADVTRFLADPLSGIVERGWGLGGRLTRRVPLGEGAARTRATEQIAEDIQTIEAGQGSEELLNQRRAAAADTTIADIQQATATARRRDAQAKARRTAANTPDTVTPTTVEATAPTAPTAPVPPPKARPSLDEIRARVAAGENKVPSTEIFDSVEMREANPEVRAVYEQGYDAARAAAPVENVPTNATFVSQQADIFLKLEKPPLVKGKKGGYGVLDYVDNPELAPTDEIVAIRTSDGAYHIQGGNHRLAAAILRGDETIPMRVIDVAPEGRVIEPGAAPAGGAASQPDSISVRVTENGQPVTKTYYDAEYSTPDNPNLHRIARDQYGVNDPAAYDAFSAEYRPMAQRQMVNDSLLREAQVEAGVRGTATETVERTLARTQFNAEADALFQLHFGDRPPMRVYRVHDVNGQMNPQNPMSLIEHAIFGENPAAAIDAIRTFRRPILRGRTNDELADSLAKGYEAVTGQPLPASVVPAAPVETPTGPTPIPDELRSQILSPDPDVSRRARRQAYNMGADRDEVARLRDEAGHPKTPRRQRRPPGAVGIVPDPVSDLSNAVEGVKRAVGQKIPTPIADEAAEAVVRPVTVNGVQREVKHADALRQRIKDDHLTQRQVDQITKPVTIRVRRNGVDTEVVTNPFDYYMDLRNKNLSTKKIRDLEKLDTPEAWTELDGLYREAFDTAAKKTLADLGPQIPKQMRSAKWAHSFFGYNRKAIMFNIFSGPKAIFFDNTGNFIRTILTGNIDALRHVPRSQYVVMKDHLDEVQLLDHPMYSAVKDSGVKSLPQDLSHTIGREEVERAAGKGNRTWWSMVNPVNNWVIRNVRNAGDNGFRYAIYLGRFQRELPAEMGKFLNFTRAKMAKGGVPEDMWTNLQRMVQDAYETGGSFSPDDIRAITKQFTPDDSFARTWAKQVDDLSARANKAQLTAMFSYKKTKIDDAISKVFLFHYFMTRSSALYVKLMLQHPQLISYEARLWEYTENQRKGISENLPDWMEGFVGFGMADGHALFVDPTMLISGIGVFQALGDGGFNKSRLEEVANGTGLIMNPLVRTAAATTGWFNTQNPFGTQQLERAVRALVNEVRFSDFGRSQGWDQWNRGMPLEDWTMDVVNGIVDYTNEIARELGAPFKDFEQTSSEARIQNQIMDIMATNAEEEGWDHERFVTAQQALLTGTPNDDVTAAIEEWSGIEGDRAKAGLILPGAQVIDVATLDRKAEEDAAINTPPDARTPEQQEAADRAMQASAKSPEAAELTAGMQQYNQAGTDLQRKVNAARTQILYGYEDVPDHYMLLMGDRVVYGSDLKAMTDEERQQLYRDYTAFIGQNVPVGAARNPYTDEVESGVLTSFDAERGAIKAANPRVDDYTTYRKYVLGMSDADKRAEREALLAVPGDTEFTAAHDRKRESLVKDGLSGDALETELDKWLSDEGAYLALLGHQYRSNQEPKAAIYTAVDDPPWRETEEAAGGGGETKEKDPYDTGKDVDKDLDIRTITVPEAHDLLLTDSISNDALRLMVGDGRLTRNTVNRWLSEGILLGEDLYDLADQPNLPATDIRYLVEDGYMGQDEVLDLIFSADADLINRIRKLNRKRKRDKENKVGPYAPKSSGGYNLINEFLLTK